jgi:hypothetical protein
VFGSKENIAKRYQSSKLMKQAMWFFSVAVPYSVSNDKGSYLN